MDLVRIIAQLKNERDAVDQVLAQLELLAIAQGKRPGSTTASEIVRSRKPFSDATKKRMAASQKKRWAAIRLARSA